VSVSLTVRPLTEADLPAAGRIVSLAFGTFLGVPDPETFWSDLNYVGGRWRADPSAAFGAEMGGMLVGSNFATRWGSVGFFGPLTVRPDLWDRGVGRRLMAPIMERLDSWGVSHAGLFTFAHSAKHVGLYQHYGFWPRALTAVMSRPVERRPGRGPWENYSEVSEAAREECVRACRAVTDALYAGLDVEREIRATHAQRLGETVLLREAGELVGFGVCHCGPGTEAGTDKCFVKFGAVRPGPSAGERFERLLDACEALAMARGLSRLEAGVNMARNEAYRAMLARGFRTDIQGVAMHRHNEPGYNRSGVYLIDDWR
jgi:GNAT superfamily N-acetyltransferase